MEYLNYINIGLGIAGAVIGGLATTFFARLFIANYVKNNDNLHQEWRRDISDIKVKLSAILQKISGIDVLENDIRGHDKKLCYLEAKVDSIWLPRNANFKN